MLTLEAEFDLDMRALDVDQKTAKEMRDYVLRAYAEPHRHYHARKHLEQIFRDFYQFFPYCRPGGPARLAAWWHDVIYVPGSKTNESESATLADFHLTVMGAGDVLRLTVSDLIHASANHWGDHKFKTDEVPFLDCDIAGLGAPGPIYRANAENIRKEFSIFTDEEFRAGRAQFLRGVLAQKQIYRTQVMRAVREATARQNMRAELLSLEQNG